MTTQKERRVLKAYETTQSVSEIARRLKLHKSTVHYILKRNNLTAGQVKKKLIKQQKNFKTKTRKANNKRVLFISDLHAPYHHPDALAFLLALHKKHNFTRIVCLGDELDHHTLSFHKKEPEALSIFDELNQAQSFMRELATHFPEVDVVESNHGSLAYRKAKQGGIPRHLVTPYINTVFGQLNHNGELVLVDNIGSGWHWHRDLILELPNGNSVYVAHEIATDCKNAIRRVHSCIVQGHFHTSLELRYEVSPTLGALWGMTGGCLLNDQAVVFNYNRNTPTRPALGCAGILDSQPIIFPMPVDKDNRWTGKIL